jgi:phytoene dehydrogenase-like protein
MTILKMETARIVIIGAGVAGLVAARHLEAAGIRPLIIEATDRVGGRIKTDKVDGFSLDHGFQVLLTEYREAKRYLDYEALKLANFRPGAVVYRNNTAAPVVDPLREPSEIFRAAFSSVGSIKDKLLVWKLQRELKRTPAETLFEAKNQLSSLAFLQNYGFSPAFIDAFFIPFFGGIFLENELKTPAPMLRFVFKMFSSGHAALPAMGMEEIPRQLKTQLPNTTFRLNTEVAEVKDDKLITADGEEIPYDVLIIATDAKKLMPRLAGPPSAYHATSTLYYGSTGGQLPDRLIGLVADKTAIVNNFCLVNQVTADYAPAGQQLLSVTLKDIPTMAHAEEAVAQEIRKICRQPNWQLKPLRRYDLPNALPNLDHLSYDYTPTEARLTERVFLAGDQLLFGSLDAAMRSGRRAAEGVLTTLQRL